MRLKHFLQEESEVKGYYEFTMPAIISGNTFDEEDERSYFDKYNCDVHVAIGYSNEGERAVLEFVLMKSPAFADWMNELLAKQNSSFGDIRTQIELKAVTREVFDKLSSRNFSVLNLKLTPSDKFKYASKTQDLYKQDLRHLDALELVATFQDLRTFLTMKTPGALLGSSGSFAMIEQMQIMLGHLNKRHFGDLDEYLEMPDR